jgi:hypothetical protein
MKANIPRLYLTFVFDWRLVSNADPDPEEILRANVKRKTKTDKKA